MTIFLISDTHFNDENVIDSFARPFESVEEMNEALIDNWNKVVSESDKVVVVGDFAKVNEVGQVWTWLGKLKGEILLVDGNHRPIPRSSFQQSSLPLMKNYEFEEEGYIFYCAHKISWIPAGYDNWKVYGHVHNKSLEKYPFVDLEKKRINVSAELIQYTPISVNKIAEFIEKGVHKSKLTGAED